MDSAFHPRFSAYSIRVRSVDHARVDDYAGSVVPFEILEHTADVGIRAFGTSLEELFSNAALGVESLALDTTKVEAQEQISLSAAGDDLESLLVNWLNEIIFYLDARQIVMSRFTFLTLTPSALSAVGFGERRDPARHPPLLVVKAATYHQLKVARVDDLWVAEVYLDI